MKIRNQSLAWAIFLLFAGAFLLAKNLGAFGPWGQAAWGGIFAAAGLGFLAWFLMDFGRWWRAIAGFTLLSIGALILLDWRGLNLGPWDGSLVLFGIALGFWTVLLVNSDNWWALIPAGVLTVLAFLIGLRSQLSEAGWLAAFFLGLGLVFGLLYAFRFGQHDSPWAAIPAAALLLLGVVTLIGALGATGAAAQWWPILLLVGGLGLLIGSVSRRAAEAPAPLGPDALPPAPPIVGDGLGYAPVASQPARPMQPAGPARTAQTPLSAPDKPLSEQPRPLQPDAAAPAVELTDIYALLARQPKPDEEEPDTPCAASTPPTPDA